MFMQMDQDVFTAVHFTETRVFLSVTSVERYRTRFQTIPGSSVVLARVEDCPELITQVCQGSTVVGLYLFECMHFNPCPIMYAAQPMYCGRIQCQLFTHYCCLLMCNKLHG